MGCDKAVYGLTTSPRDWSVRREIEIRKMEWEGDGKRMKFLETEEPNLWRIIEVETGVVRGLMSIYVDDVMLAGEDKAIETARARMDDGDWKLSPAEWATADVRGGPGGQVGHQGGYGGVELKAAGRGQQGWRPGRGQRGSGYNGRVSVVGFEDETGHCGGGCSNVEMDKERCGGCQPGQGRNEVCQGDHGSGPELRTGWRMGVKRRPWHEEASEHGGGLRGHLLRLGRGG